MGAPKQKWTSEEEAALKAGIRKYGIGKWSTILKDPEFKPILQSRSNVDLKDKYRNLNCLVLGSRQRAKPYNKSNQLTIKKDESTSVLGVVEKDSEFLGGTSLTGSCKISQGEGSKKPISRVDGAIQVKNKYRIAPKPASFSLGKELKKMKSISPEDAAKAAAKAVAEAEAAIAEAEAAAREAEEAEAEAEVARCFAYAAQRALNFQTLRTW